MCYKKHTSHKKYIKSKGQKIYIPHNLSKNKASVAKLILGKVYFKSNGITRDQNSHSTMLKRWHYQEVFNNPKPLWTKIKIRKQASKYMKQKLTGLQE